MFRFFCLLPMACVSICSVTHAAELPTASLQVQPSEFTLNGPRGVQQLIVTANADVATIHDATKSRRI